MVLSNTNATEGRKNGTPPRLVVMISGVLGAVRAEALLHGDEVVIDVARLHVQFDALEAGEGPPGRGGEEALDEPP